ncbi:thioredoxin [Flavobacterium amnicola]|uniref:Thioredoxin n=1 Tax=Flavobacterium amnicola TaxID=2506422 RepID=A0A4V1N212_9FLAO|nr:thioredoxin family protein [Flavobacterium amnicola]RXR19398.1 thioredoxin [Flavobacterium amnicola]
MRKIIYIIAILFASHASAQESLHQTFNQSIEKAKTENKKVLLYFSGSDWCAPCVKFKKQYILTDPFIAFSSENLVTYNADFPRLKKNQLTKEITQENEALAEKYNNTGIFPLILLLDTDGKIIKKWDHLPSETLEEFIAKLKS